MPYSTLQIIDSCAKFLGIYNYNFKIGDSQCTMALAIKSDATRVPVETIIENTVTTMDQL